MSKGFIKVARDKIPLNESGQTEVDLYIFMPSQDRYIRFFPKGEVIDDSRLDKISNHVVPDLFVDELIFKKEFKDKGPGSSLVYNQKKPKAAEGPPEVELEILGKAASARIHNITQALLSSPMQDAAQTLLELEAVTDEMITLVAPEAKAVKEYLLQFTDQIALMNDASAITTLGVMIGAANGFDSKKSYKELSFAALIMDIGMTGLNEEEYQQYFRDPTQLSAAAKEIVRNHPSKSHQLATEKLPSLSDATLQLVLTHHELYSGKGYPRGIRTETLAPIMKVLPLAVEVFEFIKRAQFANQNTSLLEAFTYYVNEATEAHLRRHNKKLVDSCVKYLSEGRTAPDEKKSA